METFEEFRLSVLNKERHFKVKNSWGVYDYYKYYRKNRPKDKRWALTEHQFYKLFREVNKLLADELVKSHYLCVPYQMGELQYLQKKTKTYIKDGKLKTTKVVDWDATLKLWYEDKEAKDRKLLLYKDLPSKPLLYYSKKNAMYANRAYYEFEFNRFLKNRCVKSFNNQLLCFDDVTIKNLYNG
jgi:hypothetical protein